MKLCFLANADSNHSFRWIKYFAEKEQEIHWMSLTPNNFGDIKNVKFYLMKDFSAKFLNVLLNANPIRKLIKKIKPDILHAHYAGVNGLLGALSGFHPFILTTWGSDILITPKESLTTKRAVEYTLKKADLITCDAKYMKEAIMKLGAPASKIRIINFGIDTKNFSPGSKNEKLIKELGLENSPVVISLRNLEPVYDLQTLIKATPLVLKEFPQVKFIIAGKGSEEDRLKKIVRDLKIENSVKFIGFVPNAELISYLRTSDIYVSTSLSDAGIAASTAEAMACGLPAIITDVADNKKWVKDGENGFVIPIKNPKILAERIIYLLKNKNIGRKFGEINRKTIEEKNNYYKEMEKMEEIYMRLLKAPAF